MSGIIDMCLPLLMVSASVLATDPVRHSLLLPLLMVSASVLATDPVRHSLLCYFEGIQATL